MRKPARGIGTDLSVGILVALAFVSKVAAEDRRLNKSALTIMTFNAEFLWDGVAPEEGQVDFPWKNSPDEAADHMSAIADVMVRSNPDIINLVEVENLSALEALNHTFLAGRGYKAYLVQGKDTYTGEDVGLLTRIDPESQGMGRTGLVGRSGAVAKSVSKNYYALFDVDGTRLALIGIHFLARPLDESRRLEREAQADAIRNLAGDLEGRGYEVAVLGDFNDFDGAADSIDHVSSRPVTRVLEILRGLDPSTDAGNLVNAAFFVPMADRYTAFWDANDNGIVEYPKELTSIDHILLSPMLASKVESVEIPHTHDPRLVSDHFPVVARLRLVSQPPPPPSGATVRIVALLPDPEGDDTNSESVTLRNIGNAAISLTGWILRDRAPTKWTLDALGTLPPGVEKTITRGGRGMTLNNTGDTIDLLDSSGTVIQSVTYGRVQEGELVVPSG